MPSFVCSYNATIYRGTGCSVFVVEDMIFPHSRENAALLRGLTSRSKLGESISNAPLTTDDESMDHTTASISVTNFSAVMMPNKKDVTIARLRLNYTMQNDAKMHTGECATGRLDPEFIAVRWRTDKRDKLFDVVKTTLARGCKSMSVRIGTGNGCRARTEAKTFENARDFVDIYARDDASRLYSKLKFCLSKESMNDAGEGGNQRGVRIAIISSVSIVVIICFVVCCLVCHKNRNGEESITREMARNHAEFLNDNDFFTPSWMRARSPIPPTPTLKPGTLAEALRTANANGRN